MTFSVDHVHLRSADPVAAAQFYIDALGATEVSRTLVRDSLRVVIRLDSLTFFIEGVPVDTVSPPTPPFLGLEHIGLQVTDLEKAAASLREAGVRFLAEPKEPRPGVKIAFIEAPDNVQIEIIERRAA
jgi:catechol 2,3-dioxygenase-like lactoylglutathione lyase family enzyme